MLVVLFAFLFVGAFAERWPGKCPEVSLTENIDLNKFLGKWFISHVNNIGAGRNCVLVDYQKDNSSYIVNSITYNGEGKKSRSSVKLSRAAGATNDGQLVVSSFRNGKVELMPLYMLSTDYEEYAILYACETYNKDADDVNHDAYFYVLIKQKGKLEGETLQKVENALSKYTSLTQNKPLAINDFKVKDVCNI